VIQPVNFAALICYALSLCKARWLVVLLWFNAAIAQPPRPFPTLPQLFSANLTIRDVDAGSSVVFNATVYSLDENHTRVDEWFMSTFYSQIQLIDNNQLVEYLYYKDHFGPACTSHIVPAPHPMNITQECPDPIYEALSHARSRTRVSNGDHFVLCCVVTSGNANCERSPV